MPHVVGSSELRTAITNNFLILHSTAVRSLKTFMAVHSVCLSYARM